MTASRTLPPTNQPELLQCWLGRKRPEGRASALHFSSNTLYSYAEAIAIIKGNTVQFLSPHRGSVLTTRHVNAARRAALRAGFEVAG